MIRPLALPVLAVLLMSPGVALAQEKPESANAEHLSKARAAIKGLAESLKEKLLDAMKTGGPVKAIDVCKEAAPKVTAEQSTAAGVKVGRTALKVRNPENAADEFEKGVLATFAEKMKAGADPATLEHAEMVTKDGVKTFRYMKPIPMAAQPCGLCHGAEMSADLKAEIDKRYPKDQAVGFKAGELRGAFTVIQTVK